MAAYSASGSSKLCGALRRNASIACAYRSTASTAFELKSAHLAGSPSASQYASPSQWVLDAARHSSTIFSATAELCANIGGRSPISPSAPCTALVLTEPSSLWKACSVAQELRKPNPGPKRIL